MNVAEKLSEYASTVSYHDIDERTVIEAKKRVLDSIGCAIGAFNEGPVKVARNVAVETLPGAGATILGTRSRSSPDVAAFVNGIMVRYFDYNDTYLSKEPAHPSDNIPACLATAEFVRSTGRGLLTAIAVAYEVQCRLCDAAEIRRRGWDHVCYGSVSSALGAGRLMGLSREKLTHAVNISLNAHIAMRQVRAGELSEWKGCSFANSARNAIFAALLARRGMTGPSPIFEGEMGFFKQVSGPFEIDTQSFGGRGGRFKLPETYLKYYPAEYHSQTAIWAALAARKKLGTVDEVESVEIDTHEAGYTILGKDREKWAPATKETADHSLPYIVGMALLEGRVDNTTYTAKKLRDPGVLGLLSKITVREDKSLTEMYPRSIANRITLRLRGGRTVTEQVNDPRGHPSNPMSSEEVNEKFLRLTKKFIGEARARKIIGFVDRLEEQRDVSPLLRLCAA